MTTNPMLVRARTGSLLLGITPPRGNATRERVAEIARATLARLESLDLDGLVLYDIDDESDRNPDERPFPYLPTVDPAVFHTEYLGRWQRPVVIYRCVGKYAEDEISAWLRAADPGAMSGVFVGASSRDKPVRTSLARAHTLRQEIRPDLPMGGVAITERYTSGGDEHLRMLAKQERGCTFFISQVVYDVGATKSLVSDYFYTCRSRGFEPQPVIFTLSVCGSLKTLAFLRWLGVAVPRWLENALVHAPDPLTESLGQCRANARELADFCRGIGIPFGFNVESVSIRKEEIDASVQLAAEIGRMLR
ncbi:5,10-methylenetetrahydrofolate reductase [Plantactinospora sp. B6F1]|uniref:5,10-methylenetetrahydrofolate reductase n=1 Tax=Plantactinospora sp. B6F1 TaxID=3158971 RepID=UPI0032D95E5A